MVSGLAKNVALEDEFPENSLSYIGASEREKSLPRAMMLAGGG
jgi:hypothetical protein